MRKVALATLLITSLLVPVSAQAATAKPATAKAGAKCAKLKTTQIVGTKKFTCIKSGSKLVWDKGVTVPKAPTTKPPVVVVKKAQTIEFPEMENAYLANKGLILSKAISSGGLPVTYSASGACSFDVASNTVLLNSIGKCSVTTSQAGDANYLPAESITRTFEIMKNQQSIQVEEFTAQDLAESQGLNFTFTIEADTPKVVITTTTTDVCTVNGDAVAFVAVGDCKLTFTKAGNAVYEAAPTINRTIEIISSVVTNSEESPAGLGEEVINAGISVTVDAINEEVSEAVCEAYSSNEGCLDEDGVGFLDAELNARYVEVVLTVTNNGDTTWIADQLTLMFGDESYDFTPVYEIDTIEGLELEAGDSITGSYFVLLPNELDSAESLIIYGNTEEEVSFFFKAK
jgi:archaellum component FlaF (FlaF/FlaG flagellin family)